MDEATKLLRELVEAWGSQLDDEEASRFIAAMRSARAHLASQEAPPAEAPHKWRVRGGLCKEHNWWEPIHETPCPTCVAAAQPAPLLDAGRLEVSDRPLKKHEGPDGAVPNVGSGHRVGGNHAPSEEPTHQSREARSLPSASVPAPLLGPPREDAERRRADALWQQCEDYRIAFQEFVDEAKHFSIMDRAVRRAESAMQPPTTDQGTSVIAPNPSDTDAGAKGLSRAGDDADVLMGAINAAALHLPHGFRIAISVERGSGWIDLVDSGDRLVEFDGDDLSFAAQLTAAIVAAVNADARTEGTRQHAAESTDAKVDAGNADAMNRSGS